MNDMRQAYGAVDTIRAGEIQGWAFHPVDADRRLQAILLLDGDVAGFAMADQRRPDLLERDIGDGAHGFAGRVPHRKLQQAEILTVLTRASDRLALVAERRLKPRAARPAPQRSLAVHFDITDLLVYLFHHREVSGIQRVLCSYLTHALTAPEDLFAIRVCTQPAGGQGYVEVERDAVLALLAAIAAHRPMGLELWREEVAALGLEAGAAADFQPGDMLLTIGAPWVRPTYHDAVIAARRAHGVRYVQLVHDLIPTLMPEAMAEDLAGVFNRSIAATFSCVDLILANSQHTRQDVLRVTSALGVACPPVFTVPLGADLAHAEAVPASRRLGSSQVPAGEFVLCVGTLELRKNHAVLYAIWKRMLEERGAAPLLICVGRVAENMEDLTRCLQVTGDLDGHFVRLSDVDDATLAQLYRNCLFTVFPSLYEGWGLPVSESLQFGKICVASNASSIPEVGGDWAIYFDPRDIASGYREITGLLDDRARLAALEQALAEGYRPMTWKMASDELMGVLATAQAVLPDVDQQEAERLPPLTLDRHYRFTACPKGRSGGAAPSAKAFGELADEIAQVQALRLLAGHDWHGMEDWGTWSCGTAARLGFTLPQRYGPEKDMLVCHLRLRLPHYAPTLVCRILLNDVESGRVELAFEHEHALRIVFPAALGPEVRLTLELDRLLTPTPEMADQRLLGIGLIDMHVCAADDLPARLAYVSDRLIVPRPVSERRLLPGGRR